MSKPPIDIKNPTLAATILRRLGAQERAQLDGVRRVKELEQQVARLQKEVAQIRRKEVSRALVLGPTCLEMVSFDGLGPNDAAAHRSAGAEAGWRAGEPQQDTHEREPFLQRLRRRIGWRPRTSGRSLSVPAAARSVADDCQ